MVKFLVIRLSSIGDIVLTTPVVRGLKTQVENAEIHYLTKPAFAGLVSENPYISKVHLLEQRQADTVRQLAEENFDYIIDLQHNLRSLDIKRNLKRMHFTVRKLNFRKWLLVHLKINRLPDRHIVDRYMDTTRLFDVEKDGRGLDFFIPENEEIPPEQLPPSHRNGYIALVIGANHQTKMMPVGKLVELCQKTEHPIILIGGPREKETGEELIASLPEKKVYNGAGLWTINQSASVISQARCVITPDTGMMHIAAAFKKPVITIWGNTVPDFGMNAYLPGKGSADFGVAGLSCRPCSKLGKPACPKKHFKCMLDQDTSRIIDTADELFRTS